MTTPIFPILDLRDLMMPYEYFLAAYFGFASGWMTGMLIKRYLSR
jgi:hypothetical protein